MVKCERKDDFWLNIGVVQHDDGKGFNVFLQALPLGDGNIGFARRRRKPARVDDDRRDEGRQEPSRSQSWDGGYRDDRRPALPSMVEALMIPGTYLSSSSFGTNFDRSV